MHGNVSIIHRTDYRPDIDGLRAISILLVIAVHAFPYLVPGGFIGVDIFFVISGFLITRIIITETAAGTFSIQSFYARRIRRIFPALICALAATYTIGWFVLLPNDFSQLGENIVAGAAFVFNLVQIRSTGYFATEAVFNPLMHLWSLGIEEQFYIFWPLLIMTAAGGPRIRQIMVGVAAASFIANLAFVIWWSEVAFYSPLSRAWELLAGGLLAAQYARRTLPANEGLDDLKSIVGVCLIAGSSVVLDKTFVFPGWNALLPVAGAVLLIDAPRSFLNRHLLAARPMVLLGLISYPLYLWHWPLLSYLAILRNGVPNFLEVWATIVIAIMLAWATFHFVEIPIRRRPNAVQGLAFGMAVLGVIGIYTAVASGLDFRFAPEIREIASLPSKNNSGFTDHCFREHGDRDLDESCIEQGQEPLLLLWGDSTAAALYPGLKQAQEANTFRVAQFTAAACSPILGDNQPLRCRDFNKKTIEMIRVFAPNVVLMHAMWHNGDDLAKLGETIRLLKSMHVPRIVIMGPTPVWKRTLPHTIVNNYRLRHVIADRISNGVTGPTADNAVYRVSKSEGAEFISAWHALCNSEGCLTRTGGGASDVMVSDAVHLTNSGSIFLIHAIGSELFPIQ